jgi:hypothetical protein
VQYFDGQRRISNAVVFVQEFSVLEEAGEY